MAISLNTRVSQTVNLTPQLQQSIRLLQLSNSELEQELAKAAEDNPLIEFEPNPEIESNLSQSSERIETNQNSWANNRISQDDDEEWGERYERIAHKQTLLEYLDEQVHLLNIDPKEQSLIAYIAGCLDERGYLPEGLEAIQADIGTQIDGANSRDSIENALAKLQSLDPPGIGARDLAECLSLQIDRILENAKSDSPSWELARYIVTSHLSKVGSKDWQKIKQASGKSEVEVLKAVELIRSLQHIQALNLNVRMISGFYRMSLLILNKIVGSLNLIPTQNPVSL